MKICFVGNLITLPYSPDHAGIIQALEKMELDYVIADPAWHYATKEDIVETIVDAKPDLIIHGMTDSISNEWPGKINDRLPNAIQVMSMWDYRPPDLNYDGLWDGWVRSGPFLDLITLSNKNQAEWWEKSFGVPVMYWPHGCVIKDVEYDKEFEADTVFVGERNESEPYAGRVRLLDEIIAGAPVEWINKGGGDANLERIQVWKDLGKIYHSAKTVLDVSHFWDAEGYASGRFFYTSGLGGCAISKRFPGCEELYPEGTKIYFDTAEEAIDKVKFYNKHKAARDMVKKAGKKWTNKHHNYVERFKKLFKRLGT